VAAGSGHAALAAGTREFKDNKNLCCNGAGL